MSDSIYLAGSEEVRRAGSSISSAADQINRSVSYLAEILDQQRRYMDDWISRFEAAVEKMQQSGGGQ